MNLVKRVQTIPGSMTNLGQLGEQDTKNWTWLRKLAFFSLLLQSFLSTSLEGCKEGWFGTRCQYRCNCIVNSCDRVTGECTPSTCKPYWFGPGCQYRDFLGSGGIKVKVWARDGKDGTCNPIRHQTNVHFQLEPTPVSWLRLVVKTPDALEMVDVLVNGKACPELKQLKVNQRTLDIYCDWPWELTSLTLSGRSVGALCSVYLSGGRNLALEGITRQTSTNKPGHGPAMAVDGQRSGTCTETQLGDDFPTWYINFTRPHWVRLLEIIPGQMEETALMVSAYTQDQDTVFQKAVEITKAHIVYRIPISTAHGVTSIALRDILKNTVLVLCEVQIWGEAMCPEGHWGLECEKLCSCGIDKVCYPSTGACGEACRPGLYGLSCSSICPQRCDGQCAMTTGVCNRCIWPFSGAFCGACPSGTWGDNCERPCPKNCLKGLCNAKHGYCLRCMHGYEGPTCQTESPDSDCPPGTYGYSCGLQCPAHCMYNVCSLETGDCRSCKPGHFTTPCAGDCAIETYRYNCGSRCNPECLTCDIQPEHCLQCNQGYDNCSYADKAPAMRELQPAANNIHMISMIVGVVIPMVIILGSAVMAVVVYTKLNVPDIPELDQGTLTSFDSETNRVSPNKEERKKSKLPMTMTTIRGNETTLL